MTSAPPGRHDSNDDAHNDEYDDNYENNDHHDENHDDNDYDICMQRIYGTQTSKTFAVHNNTVPMGINSDIHYFTESQRT